MTDPTTRLGALAEHIARRRPAIMAAWRARVAADPLLTTGNSLPRAQLHDHIPALLENFERTLASPGPLAHRAGEAEQEGDAAAHGLHRWQQGFDLSEVTRELGRLNECVIAEIENCAVATPSFDRAALAQASKVWAQVYGVAVSSSTSQFFLLQKLEAASHVNDLESALASLRELEAQRAGLWQQAAHDLRGNVSVVALATAGLASEKASNEGRARFLAALDRNVRALTRLLEDVTSLARLQGGQERRNLAEMDASTLLNELGEAVGAMADNHELSLELQGPASLVVEGDAIKTRRIVQNLVLNAIKYTRRGGVRVRWGDAQGSDADRWFIEVEDTGPGFNAGPGSPMAGALGVATEQARDMASAATTGEVTHVALAQAVDSSLPDPAAGHQQPGEGIGLSIVKRLCELLDATLELDSKAGAGTTIRVRLPKRYET